MLSIKVTFSKWKMQTFENVKMTCFNPPENDNYINENAGNQFYIKVEVFKSEFAALKYIYRGNIAN